MTWILTCSGKRVDLLAPTAAMIDPLDIAHSLARQCRFNGHTREHYSVAQHCYLVSEMVPEDDALAALLHDATEAYVGDLVRPLKQLLPDFAEIEHKIWLAICERFNLEEELPQAVHDMDNYMLAVERRDLMPAHPDEWPCIAGILLPEWRIKPWEAPAARIHYFSRLMSLLNTTNRRRAQA